MSNEDPTERLDPRNPEHYEVMQRRLTEHRERERQGRDAVATEVERRVLELLRLQGHDSDALFAFALEQVGEECIRRAQRARREGQAKR
jgi:hypothetical protein